MVKKGLQRLRWYCQVCEKQCRDENGFKCHTQSESHVRAMLSVGQDPRSHIRDYSDSFQRDFITLLRTSHREKKVHVNRFYQEYIADKEHIHMNATRWHSLTEFAAHLGRTGVCRVEEDPEDGLFISWIDNSPEALRRQDALRRKERQDKSDEMLEQKLIQEQVERAREQARSTSKVNEDCSEGHAQAEERNGVRREDGEKITLSIGSKLTNTNTATSLGISNKVGAAIEGQHSDPQKKPHPEQKQPSRNILAAKKNVFGKSRSVVLKDQQPKKISELERIMKLETEKKRSLIDDKSLNKDYRKRKIV